MPKGRTKGAAKASPKTSLRKPVFRKTLQSKPVQSKPTQSKSLQLKSDDRQIRSGTGGLTKKVSAKGPTAPAENLAKVVAKIVAKTKPKVSPRDLGKVPAKKSIKGSKRKSRSSERKATELPVMRTTDEVVETPEPKVLEDLVADRIAELEVEVATAPSLDLSGKLPPDVSGRMAFDKEPEEEEGPTIEQQWTMEQELPLDLRSRFRSEAQFPLTELSSPISEGAEGKSAPAAPEQPAAPQQAVLPQAVLPQPASSQPASPHFSPTQPVMRETVLPERVLPERTLPDPALPQAEFSPPVMREVPKEIPAPAPAEPPAREGKASAMEAVSEPDMPDSSVSPMLFECAWEVCWQLGGIYTVLKSKAEMMLRKWGERYFLIGPYNPNTAAMEFEEQPATGAVATALDKLRQQGIGCYHGRWLIPGRPRVILLDYRGRFKNLADDKYLLWKDHGIGTVEHDGEVNEVVAFGFSVTEFFRQLTAAAPERPILAHFHEWMAGVAVPRIAHERIKVSTVFTTHATLLGRYLAADSKDFYERLPYINADAEAAKYMIYPRFQIERAAAHASTVFTTVSEVTGYEAEKLLGRKPDRILPNGLNIKRFAALHEFQNLHLKYKQRIHEFVMGHFFPCYTFDLDNTLYIFTSGRYEYGNKGMDLFIEALWRLNHRLRWMPQRPTVVAFIVTKASTRNINVGVLQSQSMFRELKEVCHEIQDNVGGRLVEVAAHGKSPSLEDLVDDEERMRLKQGIHAWRSGRQPPIVTHDLSDDAGDPILRHLRHRWLFNAGDDPVKVIFHPQFMAATSPLLGLDYEQFVRGCHMGVFPSYYEPWGYTPMESIALGVPAVTADLSGFGAYVKSNIANHDEQGIKVLDRHKSFEDATNDLVDHLVNFAMLTRRQRIELRNKVERLGERFDWSVLISCYHDAHALALERRGVAVEGRVEVRMV